MTNYKVRDSIGAGNFRLSRDECYSSAHPASTSCSPVSASSVLSKQRSESNGSRSRSGSWRPSAEIQTRSRSGSWRDGPRQVKASTEVNYAAGGTLSRSTRPRSGSGGRSRGGSRAADTGLSLGSPGLKGLGRSRSSSWRKSGADVSIGRDSNSWSGNRSRSSSWRPTIGSTPPRPAGQYIIPSMMARYDFSAPPSGSPQTPLRSPSLPSMLAQRHSFEVPLHDVEQAQHQDHSSKEREILMDVKSKCKEFVSTVVDFTWFRGKRVMHTSIPEEIKTKWNCTNIRTMGTWKQLDDYGINLNHFQIGQKVKMIVQSVFIHDRKPEPELRGIPDPNFIHIIKEEKQERRKVHRLREDVFDAAREAFQSYVSTVVDVMEYRGHTVMWTSVPQELKERYNTTDLKTVNAWPELSQAGIDLKVFKKGDQVKMIVSDVATKGKYASGPLLYGLPDWNASMNEKYLRKATLPSLERTSLEEFLDKAFDIDKQDALELNKLSLEQVAAEQVVDSPRVSLGIAETLEEVKNEE